MTTTTRLGRFGITALLLAACGGSAGSTGTAGPAGDAGAPGAPGAAGATGPAGAVPEGGAGAASFSLVEPRVGLAGRELDVTVSVEGASLSASATLDFGDAKVAVSALQHVSATTLYAHLTIDPAATLGAHDVTVTDGATIMKGTGAFSVASEITVTVAAGSPKQGSVFAVDVRSNDTANFFDANAANFTASATGGLYSLGASGITPNSLTATFLVPPAAAAGDVEIAVKNDPTKALSWTSAPNAVTVTAQAPTALTLPFTQAAASLATAGASVYEAATSPGIGILNYTIDVASSTSPFVPEGILFPASGKVADIVGLLAPVSGLFGPNPPPYHLIASIPNTTATAMPTTLVLYDQNLGGGAGFTYDISVTNTPVAAVTAEKGTAHGTPALAQALTLPAIVNGSVAVANEIDAFSVVLPANKVLEFSLEGAGGVLMGVPADQTGLVISPASGGGTDTTASAGLGAFVDTQIFTQAATPTTTTVYFIVTSDPNTSASTQTGAYTFSVRIVP